MVLPRKDKDVPTITLWGASGSGKSALINAFFQQLYILNQPDNGHDLFYDFFEGYDKHTRKPVYVKEKRLEPTKELDDRIIHIQRHLRNEKNSRYYFLYPFPHTIRISDISGEQAIAWARGENDDIQPIIEISDNMILTLDPTRKEERSRIFDDLLAFCNLLPVNGGRKKHIAICYTKMDYIVSHNEFEASFDKIQNDFIKFFYNRSKTIETSLRDKADVKFFGTSAMGYFHTETKGWTRNYREKTGWLKRTDIDLWHPKKVVDPFFWIFDCIEKDYLKTKPITYKLKNWLNIKLNRSQLARRTWMSDIFEAEFE